VGNQVQPKKDIMLINSFKHFLHKLARFLPGGYSIRPFLHRLRGVKIGKNVWISQYVYLDDANPENISIGDNCTIGLNSSIYTHFYWGPQQKNIASHVIIEDEVFIGPHCLILPNTHIGKGAVIKGGTVVTGKVPANTLWGLPDAGPLAKVTVPLTAAHSYEEFVRGLRSIKEAKGQGQKEKGK